MAEYLIGISCRQDQVADDSVASATWRKLEKVYVRALVLHAVVVLHVVVLLHLVLLHFLLGL